MGIDHTAKENRSARVHKIKLLRQFKSCNLNSSDSENSSSAQTSLVMSRQVKNRISAHNSRLNKKRDMDMKEARIKELEDENYRLRQMLNERFNIQVNNSSDESYQQYKCTNEDIAVN